MPELVPVESAAKSVEVEKLAPGFQCTFKLSSVSAAETAIFKLMIAVGELDALIVWLLVYKFAAEFVPTAADAESPNNTPPTIKETETTIAKSADGRLIEERSIGR